MLYIGRGPRSIGNKISGALLISKYKEDGTLLFHKMDTAREVYYKTVLPCTDKSGFYMGTGCKFDFVPNQNLYQTKYLLYKYNYNGDTIWTRRYADSVLSGYVNNDAAFTDMITVDEDNLLLTGTNTVMKLDKNGNILWQRMDLIGGKVIKLKNADEYIVWDLYGRNIYKLDYYGNVLWKRDYKKDPFVSIYSIASICATDDGGFIMCIQEDGIWRIVKLDCDGNVDNPIDCKPKPKSNNEMEVFADETNNGLQLSWLNTSNYQLKIFNTIGQSVWQTNITNARKATIDLGEFATGIYYVRVLDIKTNQLFTHKFLKK
jgi:hypothetical protein